MTALGMNKFLYLIRITGFVLVFSGKRGLKQRLEESGVEAAQEPSSSSTRPSSSSTQARGGIRGRTSADPGGPKSEKINKGPFVEWLKSEWAKGKLTTAQVQQAAMSAEQHGCPNINSMASLGNYGSNPGNLFRAMKNLIGYPTNCAPISYIELPTKRGRRTPHPVLWPHLYLKNFNTETFNGRLRGHPDASRQFWEHMRGTDFLTLHPNMPEEHWKHTIPIGIHGDGGSFSKQDNVYVLAFNSLVAAFGPTHDTRIVFTLIRKAEMVADTMDKLLEAWSWSLNVCLTGLTPDKDWQKKQNCWRGPAVAGRVEDVCCTS